VSEVKEKKGGSGEVPGGSTRLYIAIAAILIVIIVVAAVLLITLGLPALRGEREPTAAPVVQATATTVPTFTPGPTKEPTLTPEPTYPPAIEAPVMADIEDPLYVLEGAAARPGVDWTGFFGTVQDAAGNPLADVPLIVWYRDGQPASPVVRTNLDGSYEIRLADAPLSGTWTIQVLDDGGQPASKLLTFQTDENVESGIQQIQVIWKKTDG
jgi:hypothetical protein